MSKNRIWVSRVVLNAFLSFPLSKLSQFATGKGKDLSQLQTGKGFINFGKGSFLGKDPFLKLMNPFPVAAFPGKGKDLSQ